MKTSFALRTPDAAIDALNHGVACGRRGAWRDALPHFRRATELSPTLAPAWINLATTLAMLDELGGTERAFCQAIRLQPREASYASRYGWWLIQRGRLEEAEQAFRHARSLAPRDPGPAAGLAGLCERRGELDEAGALLRPHLDSGDARVAELQATVARRQGRPADGLPAIERALQRQPRHPGLHFHRAQLLHALGRHDEAFGAWSEANAARGWRFDPRVLEARLQGILAAPTAGPTSSVSDERVVFVCGMPRSGTSLSEQILGCHPDVHPAGERETLRQLARSIPALLGRQGPWWTCLDELQPAHLDALAARYLEGLPATARVVDKMPMNVWLLGLAARMLPRARVVVVERDPLDTALSCFQQDFAGMAFAWATTLEGCALRLRAVRWLTAHWRRELSSPLRVQGYEDLVRQPEREIRALCDFVGLSFEPACLHPERSTRIVHTASYAQVTRPIHAGAVGKAEPYADHLDPVRRILGL